MEVGTEREVEVVGLDHREQVVGVVCLVEHELHLRALGGEPGEDAREDLGADALHQADAEASPLSPGDLLHLGGGHAQRGEHGVGVLEEERAGRGEPHRSRPAGPVEHRGAGHPLEGGDLLAHRRLGVAERLGRLPEGAGLGDGDEGLEVTYFEVHELSISDADQACKR